jgi:hypothetical protein
LKELLAVAAGLNSRHFLLDEIIKFCKNKNFNEFSVFPYVVLAARGEKISTIMEMWDLSSSCSEVRRLLECIALCSPRVRHAIVADEEPDRIIEKYGFILEGSKETIKKMALPKNKDLIENLRLEINPDFSIENSDFSVGECHDRPNGSISIVLIPYLEPRQREEDPRTVSGFGGCVNNEGRAHIHALTAQLSYPDSILKEEQIREILKPAFEAR